MTAGGILVTGAGTIGLHVAQLLVEQGREVTLADVAPDLSRIEAIVDVEAVRIATLDVTDTDALATIARQNRFEGVIHTAALLTGAAHLAPARAVAVNLGGAINVMELARRGAVGRVILAGSTSVQYATFGVPSPDPIPEDFAIRVVSQAPASIYATTKLAAEFLAGNYAALFDTDLAVLRYAAVLGATLRPDAGLVSRLVGMLLEKGSRGEVAVIDDPRLVWDGIEEFVDPRDCAAGSVAALDALTLDTRIYTLTNPIGYTFERFIDTVRALHPTLRVDLRVPIRGGFASAARPRTALSDIDAARRELGYRPAYDLRQSFEYLATLLDREKALR
jgi:UDP-glucose 4-epimerase